MPEVNAPTQQQPMEVLTESGVVAQQPESQPQMNAGSEEMSLRGGCMESCGCCGLSETCGCC
ncbi:hypothetical protein VM1G_11389 [Cytospora mali]|uniref:Uncharacterized protein n=1 Tax=Cytospora mali TaxID=578113 RepID=A0A194VQQ8_CYTMA|nr:hypothetical protein VM1G_11389 [Valsa mali]